MADTFLMAGKSVLVTGGTGGIGKATATGLAALGARVGITGRDHARTEAAAAGICAATGSPAVDAFAADMSVQAGVRRLAAQVLDAYPRLDVLVNNAGGFWAHRHVTADGLERAFALNHLAPDRPAAGPAHCQCAPRIVTVSSGAHAGAALTSTICRASGTTPGSARTASRSWPA
jgi:NAD(P)-dependent dehydrogenase (short-subunit alcohol dehydrogenase family)